MMEVPMEEGKEGKCFCHAAYVYRLRENKRIWEDKQEMKRIGSIEQQLERMQMVSGFHIITVCVWCCVSVSVQDTRCVCAPKRAVCSEQTLHALHRLCERSIICA